jgi:hypothetical protein
MLAKSTNFTWQQIREISSPAFDNETQSCDVFDFNYDKVATMTFEDAISYRNEHESDNVMSCDKIGSFVFDIPTDTSYTTEMNLICDKSEEVSYVLFSFYVGCMIGGVLIGILGDK